MNTDKSRPVAKPPAELDQQQVQEDEKAGFRRVVLTDRNGKQSVHVTTDFEPARSKERAGVEFTNGDEPGVKLRSGKKLPAIEKEFVVPVEIDVAPNFAISEEPGVLHGTVIVRFDGPIETIHINVLFNDAGNIEVNNLRAINQAKQLALRFVRAQQPGSG